MVKRQKERLLVVGVIFVIGVFIISRGAFTNEPTKPGGHNGAIASLDMFNRTLGLLQNCSKYHLIVMYFRVTTIRQYKDVSSELGEARDKELLETLEMNLNHSCIEKVHLLYINEDDLERVYAYFKENENANTHKLQPAKWPRLLHMIDFFSYASGNLVGKPTIAMNADIVLGDGLEEINTDDMGKNKYLYTLSWNSFYQGCSPINLSRCGNYHGSHDTHIFQLNEAIDMHKLKRLDYPINIQQAENGMIHAMRKYLSFTVKNPCLTIKTYHKHCVPIRSADTDETIRHLGWDGSEIAYAKPETIQFQL